MPRREGFCVGERGILWATLLALLGVAAGFVIARNPLPHGPVSNPTPQPAAPKSNTAPNSKPQATTKPTAKTRESAAPTAIDPSKIMTLEEAAAGIQAALAKGNQPARFEALQRIANAVALADIPKALMLANAITFRDLKANFVSILIGRWAESDPVAAITYA